MEIELNDAQTKLYELGTLAWEGQEIVITRKGKPYLLLVVHSDEGQADVTSNPRPDMAEDAEDIESHQSTDS